MNELLILMWNNGSYFINGIGKGTWKSGSHFIYKDTKFTFTNDKSMVNKCHIILFGIYDHGIHNQFKNVNFIINELKNIEKPSFQKWFTLSSEDRYGFKNEDTELLLNAGIDKILYESYSQHKNTVPGLIHRGIAREYVGDYGKDNFGPEMFFKSPISFNKINRVFIACSHPAEFNRYGNVNNTPYNFPYKSRSEYLSELMKSFPCHSFGKCNNNVGQLIDNQYTDNECWNNKLKLCEKYKFTCAIENCLEETYSEKIFQAYLVSSIPIISIKDILKILPEKSYISIHDFSSATELGNYLLKVATNKELYESYFEWKKNPETFKINYPKFYNMITSSQNPYFLKNLYYNEEIEDCDEECMIMYNKYVNEQNF